MKGNETALRGIVGKARGMEGVWSHLDVSDVFKMRGSDEKHPGTKTEPLAVIFKTDEGAEVPGDERSTSL